MLNAQNMLEGERLLLRPLSLQELMQIKDGKAIESPVEAEAASDFVKAAISKKIEKMHGADEAAHHWYTYWLIIDKARETGAGFIGFKGIPDENGYTEVGYSISAQYRRRGLMTEALSLLIDWAFQYPACKGITACKVLKTNIGSQRVLENCRFTLLNSSEEYYDYILKK